MINKKINKRGTDKVMSVYWFAAMFFVAFGISYMVISFYGNPYDVRQLEADALTDKIADCVSNAGYLKMNVLTSNFSQNFPENCGINFDVEDIYDWKTKGQFYSEVQINNFANGNVINSFFSGSIELKEFCKSKGKKLPVCLERSFYTIDVENNKYEVKILSIVRKTEKNVQ